MSNDLTFNEQLNNDPELANYIVEDNEDFTVYKTKDGYKKEMKYYEFSTVDIDTLDNEQQIELYKVFNDSDFEKVVPMRNKVGDKIKIEQFFTRPYNSFDEQTGETKRGVTTTIYDGEKYYVTSSKSVYFNLINLSQTFAMPGSENYNPIIVEIVGKQQARGVQISLSLVGFEN